jgi:hypothetical protein
VHRDSVVASVRVSGTGKRRRRSEQQTPSFGATIGQLASTLPTAYEAIDVRREIYEVLYPLWPERGPCSVERVAARAQ